MNIQEFQNAGIPTVNSFITDPPYTYHGALLFILRGLMILECDNQQKEFYVLLNEQMMGTHFQKIQQTLHDAGIMLYRVIPNFSQYSLPESYEESNRASILISELGLDQAAVTLSSSSNMYIFRTASPDLNFLAKQINYSEVYNHYAEI